MPTTVGPNGPCKDCNATGLRGDTALCATCDGSGGFVTTPDEATEVAEPVLRDS